MVLEKRVERQREGEKVDRGKEVGHGHVGGGVEREGGLEIRVRKMRA
jgi:hypothetical protein